MRMICAAMVAMTMVGGLAHAAGPEGGLIVAGMALMFGSAAAAIALALAFVQFRRAQTANSSRLLLAWCSLVPLGFVAVFVYAYVHRA